MLKLVLVDNNKILWEIPLHTSYWDRRELRSEFKQLRQDLENIEQLFNALSNTGRIKMMCSLFESDNSLAFTELMTMLNMNPKIVSESTKRLRNTGFIEKDEKGKYKPTNRGEAQFMMMSIALRHMMEILDRI